MSYWELKGWFASLDAVIVGAGIVGISAALRLKERHPKWNVVVVDKSSLGGATSRNAGFACFGSPSELLEDWASIGAEETIRLVQMRWEGLKLLRTSWGDESLNYQACGSVEAFTDPELFESCRSFVPELNAALNPILGGDPFVLGPVRERLGLNHVCGIIGSPLEGSLDTSRLVQTLFRALESRNIPCLTGLEVTGLNEDSDGWSVSTNFGDLTARRVFVATNAWAASLLDLDVRPAANSVIVTQTLTSLNLPCTVHHDRGYVYAREIDGKLLIGGGRHWQCPTEEDRINRLVEWAHHHIQGTEEMHICHSWTGQLGTGASRLPVVEEIKPRLYAGVRLGGMGVAIGSRVGRQLADLV